MVLDEVSLCVNINGDIDGNFGAIDASVWDARSAHSASIEDALREFLPARKHAGIGSKPYAFVSRNTFRDVFTSHPFSRGWPCGGMAPVPCLGDDRRCLFWNGVYAV